MYGTKCLDMPRFAAESVEPLKGAAQNKSRLALENSFTKFSRWKINIGCSGNNSILLTTGGKIKNAQNHR